MLLKCEITGLFSDKHTVTRSTRISQWCFFACPRTYLATRSIAARFLGPIVFSRILFLSIVARTSTSTKVFASGLRARISSSSLPNRKFFPTHRHPFFARNLRAYRSPSRPILDFDNSHLLEVSLQSNSRNAISHLVNFEHAMLTPDCLQESIKFKIKLFVLKLISHSNLNIAVID
jgi:hypothetical protein